MNLKFLNKTELDQRIKNLAQRERDLLNEVLLTIKEIDTRRTYLELGFGSLFEYLVRGVGYSEGSAQRRIDAARLIREIPEIAEKIQTGELKLNQVSLVQKASREIFKTQSKMITVEKKLEVLQSIANKNNSESQKQVAEFFDLPIIQATKETTQANESVRIEFTLSKETYAKVQKAQDLVSHNLTTRDLTEFLEHVADKIIQQKTGQKPSESKVASNKKTKSVQVKGSAVESSAETTATVAVSRLSVRTKKIIFQKQSCCQYTDPKTGKQCQSTWKLQVDHKQSHWAGGGHEPENLQILCARHNQMKYRAEAGIRYRI